MLGQYHCGCSLPHVFPLYLILFANIDVPDIPRSIFHVEFCVLSFQRIHLIPRPCVMSHNMVIFIVWIYCFLIQLPVWWITLFWLFIIFSFSIFAATLHIWKTMFSIHDLRTYRIVVKRHTEHKRNYMEFNLVERQL
jgi:hypothetical protein